jgi:hypothetical protein
MMLGFVVPEHVGRLSLGVVVGTGEPNHLEKPSS